MYIMGFTIMAIRIDKNSLKTAGIKFAVLQAAGLGLRFTLLRSLHPTYLSLEALFIQVLFGNIIW